LSDNEYHVDDRLRFAFDHRYENPAGYERALSRAVKGMGKEISTIPDAEATATREDLVAAVMSAA